MMKLLQRAIEEVRELSEGEQNDLAGALFAHITGTASYRLTNEQVKEVKARMANKKPRYASKKQIEALWKK